MPKLFKELKFEIPSILVAISNHALILQKEKDPRFSRSFSYSEKSSNTDISNLNDVSAWLGAIVRNFSFP